MPSLALQNVALLCYKVGDMTNGPPTDYLAVGAVCVLFKTPILKCHLQFCLRYFNVGCQTLQYYWTCEQQSKTSYLPEHWISSPLIFIRSEMNIISHGWFVFSSLSCSGISETCEELNYKAVIHQAHVHLYFWSLQNQNSCIASASLLSLILLANCCYYMYKDIVLVFLLPWNTQFLLVSPPFKKHCTVTDQLLGPKGSYMFELFLLSREKHCTRKLHGSDDKEKNC